MSFPGDEKPNMSVFQHVNCLSKKTIDFLLSWEDWPYPEVEFITKNLITGNGKYIFRNKIDHFTFILPLPSDSQSLGTVVHRQ